MSEYADVIAHYLSEFDEGGEENAFHCLIEMSHDALPELEQAYHTSVKSERRLFLLNVIWEHRQQSTIPVLQAALYDQEPEIWQMAMDGLVALASQSSLRALESARTRQFTSSRDRQCFQQWLEEAIEQCRLE